MVVTKGIIVLEDIFQIFKIFSGFKFYIFRHILVVQVIVAVYSDYVLLSTLGFS